MTPAHVAIMKDLKKRDLPDGTVPVSRSMVRALCIVEITTRFVFQTPSPAAAQRGEWICYAQPQTAPEPTPPSPQWDSEFIQARLWRDATHIQRAT